MVIAKMTEHVTNTVTNAPALMALLEKRVKPELVSLTELISIVEYHILSMYV